MKKYLKVDKKEDIITLASNIVYEQKPDWCNATVRPLELSLLRPRTYFSYDTKERYPLLVWICGGGFAGVDHNVWIPEMVYFAKKGYAVASLSYSIKDETRYPEQEMEVKSAIRYLRAHAEDFHINADKIIIMGESAGGYLSVFTGLTNGKKEYEAGENLDMDSSVQGVIAWYPVIYPFEEISPKINTLPDLSQMVTKEAPPFLIFHGLADKVVPCEQSKKLYEALQKYSVPADLYLIEGAEHGDQHFAQEPIKEIMLDYIRNISDISRKQ